MEVCAKIFRDFIELIGPVRKRGDIFLDFDAGLELQLQEVTLVEEEDEVDVLEERVGADGGESLKRVVNPVDLVILF